MVKKAPNIEKTVIVDIFTVPRFNGGYKPIICDKKIYIINIYLRDWDCIIIIPIIVCIIFLRISSNYRENKNDDSISDFTDLLMAEIHYGSELLPLISDCELYDLTLTSKHVDPSNKNIHRRIYLETQPILLIRKQYTGPAAVL